MLVPLSLIAVPLSVLLAPALVPYSPHSQLPDSFSLAFTFSAKAYYRLESSRGKENSIADGARYFQCLGFTD